ncbi:MAG: hypothetical protein Q7L07_03400 [Pseudohongiella sp.]|nr:hypothetical protein [Pseudohongiella sp.]
MAVANSQIRVIAENLARSATLSVEPELDNIEMMPIANVQNSNRTLSFRSTAVDEDGITLSFEMPARRRLSAVVLYGHNLKVGDKWKVKLWGAPGKTGDLFETEWMDALVPKKAGEMNWGIDNMTSTVFDDWDMAYSVIWFGSKAAQSGEILIVSDGNADGYIEINRLLFGQAVSPIRNFSFGYELDYLDTSTHEMTEGGSSKVDQGHLRRVINLALPRLLDTERSAWADFLRNVGRYNEIFVSLFPEAGGKLERDYSMVCVVKSHSPLKNIRAAKYALNLTLQET